jgi:ankyrin repeat protein
MTPDAAFEAAANAVVEGDEAALKALLAQYPDLIHARSGHHGATLLHYTAANGVETERQKTPVNAMAIARTLLEAGADPNATAQFHGAPMATLGLLVSSVHPHQAGLQAQLADLLLDAGAEDHATLLTALAYGYGDTAEDLARRLPVDSLPVAAGLGRADIFGTLWPEAAAEMRHQAVTLAAMHGHMAILDRLVAAGENLNRFNPKGFHGHATPLHVAVWKGQAATVRWLVEHGARTDIKDSLHGGTPLGWASHEGHDAIARYLESPAI